MALPRHIRQLNAWADARPRYRIVFAGGRLSFWSLTDEAIAEVRSEIAGDIRSERRNNRRNREIWRAADPRFVAGILGGAQQDAA